MARLTAEQKEDLLADYHTGEYSKNQLAKKYNTSHTTVNKITKDLEPKHKDKVSTISTMRAELLQESFKEVSAVETAIEERTKHLLYFQDSALENQRIANELVKGVDKLSDVESHSRITAKNKETVLGKDPQTQINNTNAQQTNVSVEDVSKAIADGLPD